MNKNIFIIVIILVLAIGGIVGCLPTSKIGSKEKIILAEECPDKAKFVIEQKGFTDIHLCQQEERIIDNKAVWFVQIEYSPWGDCMAGCFYTRFQGIVDDTKIYELGSAPSVYSYIFIQEICGSEAKVVKYNDSYKWAVFFRGSPGGKMIYLKNETIVPQIKNIPKQGQWWLEDIYKGWDTTELVINNYTNIINCNDSYCTSDTYTGMDFDNFMRVKGNELFGKLGIDTSQLQQTYNRKTSEVKCINNKIIANIEILDNKNHCKHKFNLYLDGSNDKYLGCEEENNSL